MSVALRVRHATAADLPSLHALIERAYRGQGARAGWTHEADLIESPRTSSAELAAILANPEQLMLVAPDADGPVGCVAIGRVADGLVHLGMLTIDPARQAAGLGRRLLGEAERVAVERFDAVRIELSVVSVRAELAAYYERRGYAATGEMRAFPVTLDPPLFLMVMEKRLIGHGVDG